MCDDGGDAGIGGDLADLMAAIERLRVRSGGGRTPAELGQDLIRLRRACDLLELEFSAWAAGFAASDQAEREGAAGPIAWIRHACRMTGHAAARAICVGEQAENLPRSAAAMTAGQIGFEHMGLMASVARTASESPTATGFDEGPLLGQALEHDVSRFRHDCAHARHALDAQAFLAEQVEDVEARRLELLPCADGALLIRGFLDAVGGATLRSALEPLARPTGSADQRRRERRLADALVELAGHGLDAGVVPERGGYRAHLQVTASLETLAGVAGAPAGELELSLPIAAATVQRLACDASVTRVLLGPDSAVVDVGRSRRVPATSTRRALNQRDKGCVWPGCDRPASWTQAHHLTHWAHGGDTDLDNLVLLCQRHHWMIHEGGWMLVRADTQWLAVPPLPEALPQARAPDEFDAA